MNIETFLEIQKRHNSLELIKDTYHDMGGKTSIEFSNRFKLVNAEYEHALKELSEREDYITFLEKFIANNCGLNKAHDDEAEEFYLKMNEKHYPGRIA